MWIKYVYIHTLYDQTTPDCERFVCVSFMKKEAFAGNCYSLNHYYYILTTLLSALRYLLMLSERDFHSMETPNIFLILGS